MWIIVVLIQDMDSAVNPQSFRIWTLLWTLNHSMASRTTKDKVIRPR